MKPLTNQQKKVLKVVEDYVQRDGFPPTQREIGEAIGVSNVSAVRGHLLALEKKGYITRHAERARSIRVLHSPSAFSRFKQKLHEVFRTDERVFHQIVYGLAWVTWQRRPDFKDPRRQLLAQAFEREAIEHGWRLIEKRIEPDHVVLIVGTWPNHSPELAVRRFQAAGRAVKRRYRRQFSEQPLWGRGYVATTDLGALDELVRSFLNELSQDNTRAEE